MAELQEQTGDAQAVREENRKNQKLLWQAEELQSLRKEEEDFKRLQAEVDQLRLQAQQQRRELAQKQADQLSELSRENARLRQENEKLVNDPKYKEAKIEVVKQQLRYIAHALETYGQRNEGKLPPDLPELKYYVPADVFPTLEVEKFEILQGSHANVDLHTTPLVRTREPEGGEFTVVLFGDGHVEARTP